MSGAAEGLRGQHGHEPGDVHLWASKCSVRCDALRYQSNRVNIGPNGGDHVPQASPIPQAVLDFVPESALQLNKQMFVKCLQTAPFGVSQDSVEAQTKCSSFASTITKPSSCSCLQPKTFPGQWFKKRRGNHSCWPQQ